MMEPCCGRDVNCEADGETLRFERSKKLRNGSKDPKSRVSLSAAPEEPIAWLNCCRTLEASVAPAIEAIVPCEFGVFISNCCAEARLYSSMRSAEERVL